MAFWNACRDCKKKRRVRNNLLMACCAANLHEMTVRLFSRGAECDLERYLPKCEPGVVVAGILRGMRSDTVYYLQAVDQLKFSGFFALLGLRVTHVSMGAGCGLRGAAGRHLMLLLNARHDREEAEGD